ncbi:MAG: hypothetical protein ACLTW9_10090, partial [Enterocloster sp.]
VHMVEAESAEVAPLQIFPADGSGNAYLGPPTMSGVYGYVSESGIVGDMENAVPAPIHRSLAVVKRQTPLVLLYWMDTAFFRHPLPDTNQNVCTAAYDFQRQDFLPEAFKSRQPHPAGLIK